MTSTKLIQIALLLPAVVGLALGGCATTPRGSVAEAIAEYDATHYDHAFDLASVAMQNSQGVQRDEAAYVAGLAAYQLGRATEAEAKFISASNSTNLQTASNARVMLGQLRLDQRRPHEAANYFTSAMPGLSGEDARRCAHNAAVAYQLSGNSAASKQWLATADATPASGNSGPSASPRATAAAESFTLQVGAFHDRKRAKRAAKEASDLAERDGLGKVQLFTRADGQGRRLYVVQIGSFPSRDAAVAARSRMGRTDYIVAPLSS